MIFSFDTYYEQDDLCALEDLIDLIEGADPEEHGSTGYAGRYVPDTVAELLIQLAQAVLVGRRASVIRDLVDRIIVELAEGFEMSPTEWRSRFVLRPVHPGGRQRLVLDILDLARTVIYGRAVDFARLWRTVFVDRGDPMAARASA
jgi:hypothetical protein